MGESSKVTINGITFSPGNVLSENLDSMKKAVNKSWDGVYIIDGMEGSGKSTFGMMISYYLSDGRFNIDNIVWTPEQFEKAIDSAEPKTAILWDEFVLGGLSSDAITSMQKSIVKKFTLIRKKRLFIGLVIPFYFMLSPYFAIARTRFLIHVTTPDGITRGRYRFYNYKKKKNMYWTGKRKWDYGNKLDADFPATFSNYKNIFIDDDEYQKRKDAVTMKLETAKDKYKMRFYHALYWIYKNYPGATQKSLGAIFGMSDNGIRYAIKVYEESTNEVDI